MIDDKGKKSKKRKRKSQDAGPSLKGKATRTTSSEKKQKTAKDKVLSEKQLLRSLNPLRQQLEVLVNQANNRVQDLLVSGKSSRALEEAQRSWAKLTSRREDETLFKSDLKTRREINREFARVHSFLNDYTSTLQGADDLTTSLHNLSGNFGANWNDSGVGKNYNTDVIDDEKAKSAFSIYRKVLEAAGGWDRAIGFIKGKESLIGYGSENLINNIYDMIDNDYDEQDIMSIALEQVESGIRAYEEMASKQVANYDYGVTFDDQTAIERRNFYTWRRKNNRG